MNKGILAGITSLALVSGAYVLPTVQAADSQLLPTPWHLTGNNGAAEAYQSIASNTLSGKDNVSVTYNLHGLCALPGDASALVFDQNGWKAVSLSAVGKNCTDGNQTVSIPLSSFKDVDSGKPLDPNAPLTGSMHVRFWAAGQFTVDIASVTAGSGTSAATPTPTSGPSATPTPSPTLTPTPLPVPATTSFTGISDGAVVSHSINVGYQSDPATTSSVAFAIDGNLKTMERYSPYYLGGDNNGVPYGWNTSQIADGQHVLTATVTKKTGNKTTSSLKFTVNNAGTAQATPTPTPTTTLPSATPTPTPTGTASSKGDWVLQSVDAMKDTKDAVCGQRDDAWIAKWVDKAVELGATHVAISMPYDNPDCGDSAAYASRWIKAIRAKGLKVWHRQMPMAFEGIYGKTKTVADYLPTIANYVKAHPDQYQDGDIFTPVPEPQNGGIAGITYCANNVCQWQTKEEFNSWLRNAMTTSKNALDSIGVKNIGVGYFGFDGFVAWGANNPDWHGILEDATVSQMGNITIDHYPELIGSTMKQGLDELQAKYPTTPIVIGEWGTVKGGDTESQVLATMGAAKRPGVVGFNYWQFGPSGSGEQLINDQFTNLAQFDEVQSYYKGTR